MTESFISTGFRGRRQSGTTAGRLPPGQYETRDFPVLSAGPTPRTSLATWDFTLRGPGEAPAARWTWSEFQALPHETVTRDIHCVTKWSKFDTVWEGVSFDTLLAEAEAQGVQPAPYVLAVSRWLHDKPAARRRDGRQGVGGGDIRWCAARARARRSRPASWYRTSTSGRARSGCGNCA
jgi:Oxidoreductase molybdopterin binding domain